MLNFKRNQTKLVFTISAKKLLAGVWLNGLYKGSQTFIANEAGLADFTTFCEQFANAPICILADAVEEDYRIERIAHTLGKAKRELIERKLNQCYRHCSFRAAFFLAREPDKRRDDQYVFAALNNTDFMQPWIVAIETLKMSVLGVYLLPMLSEVIVREHKRLAPNILLCEKLSSGFRQTFCFQGRLRMSRLVADLPTQTTQANFYLAEIEKTRLYLVSQRLMLNDTPMQVVFLSHDTKNCDIEDAISHELGLSYVAITTSQFARRLRLSITEVSNSPELIHMQLLINGHVPKSLAPYTLTQQYRVNKMKRVIYGASISLFSISVLLASWMLWLGRIAQEASLQAEKDTFLQAQRYKVLAKDFAIDLSTMPINANDLELAVNIEQKIATFPNTPIRMMQVVSRALLNLPNIQINRLRWLMAMDANIKDEDSLVLSDSQNHVNKPFTLNLDTHVPNEMAFLTAEIADFGGNYRAALESMNQFVTTLKKDPAVAWVVVLQAPVNVSSFANLQGSTNEAPTVAEVTTQKAPAIFKCQILLKPDTEKRPSKKLPTTKLPTQDLPIKQLPIRQLLTKQLKERAS